MGFQQHCVPSNGTIFAAALNMLKKQQKSSDDKCLWNKNIKLKTEACEEIAQDSSLHC